MSFLRKQQSRLLCACSCGLDGQSRTLEYFLDSRLRGNDPLGLARQENRRLLHSAKMLLPANPPPPSIYIPYDTHRRGLLSNTWHDQGPKNGRNLSDFGLCCLGRRSKTSKRDLSNPKIHFWPAWRACEEPRSTGSLLELQNSNQIKRVWLAEVLGAIGGIPIGRGSPQHPKWGINITH